MMELWVWVWLVLVGVVVWSLCGWRLQINLSRSPQSPGVEAQVFGRLFGIRLEQVGGVSRLVGLLGRSRYGRRMTLGRRLEVRFG